MNHDEDMKRVPIQPDERMKHMMEQLRQLREQVANMRAELALIRAHGEAWSAMVAKRALGEHL